MMMADLDELRRLVADLDADLDIWDERDEGASARARRAANEAMEEIDKAIAELHRIRAKLVGEIRAFDDATAKRVDAMLAERKG